MGSQRISNVPWTINKEVRKYDNKKRIKNFLHNSENVPKPSELKNIEQD